MKLRRRWVGPFHINRVINPIAYEVDLPPQWQVHPSFHVYKLKSYHRSDEFIMEVEPSPLVLVEGELKYEVEAIIQHCGPGA